VGELAIIYDRKDQFLGMGLFDPDGPIRVRMLHTGKPQKLDQRENRRIVGSLSRGRRVLNAFSFSGGFSLYAARGGAVSVTDLDIRQHALDAANRNFDLNQHDPVIRRCLHESVKADVFDWLRSSTTVPQSFDLILLDPPSLARREAERVQAIVAYGRLARHAIELVRPAGILVACSCSAHVSVAEFLGAVRKAAAQSGRAFTEMQTTGHAADHPAAFPEANYLKAIYLSF
jgi:23S rRNA (cytosine1962-C5)-methyltransferase